MSSKDDESVEKADTPVSLQPKVRFWKATGLLLSGRFADWSEYIKNGDTEN